MTRPATQENTHTTSALQQQAFVRTGLIVFLGLLSFLLLSASFASANTIAAGTLTFHSSRALTRWLDPPPGQTCPQLEQTSPLIPNPSPIPVPEPSSLLLLATGLFATAALARLRGRR